LTGGASRLRRDAGRPGSPGSGGATRRLHRDSTWSSTPRRHPPAAVSNAGGRGRLARQVERQRDFDPGRWLEGGRGWEATRPDRGTFINLRRRAAAFGFPDGNLAFLEAKTALRQIATHFEERSSTRRPSRWTEMLGFTMKAPLAALEGGAVREACRRDRRLGTSLDQALVRGRRATLGGLASRGRLIV